MKKSILLFFALFLLVVNNVSAHSVLQSTSPRDGDVITTDLTKVKLTFESKIEEGSKLLLVNEAGETIPANVIAKDAELIATLDNPLDAGNYTVNWEAASTDGHLLDGSFTFKVNETKSDESNEETDENTNDVKQDHTNVEDTEEQNVQTTDESKEGSSNGFLVYGIIGVLAIAVIISFFVIKK